MKRPATRLAGARRGCAAVAVAVLAGCAAGCGQTASHQAPPSAPVIAPSLNTSLATTAGTWAAVVMGGTASSDNAFSQLFTRTAGSTNWKLVTPPGVATNGGLVLATQDNKALIAGFRPGVDLTFSALTATRDNGSTWQPGSPLQPGLADVPDALAAAPGGGQMLALLLGGTLTQSADDGAHWSPLSSARSLAETPAGRQCSPAGLTGVSFTRAGAPLAAATCTRPGITGIFSYTAAGWQAAGPSLPAPLAGTVTGVLRLTGTPAGNQALLVAGTGAAGSLLAAQTSDDGAHWTVSAPLRLGAATVRSSGFGASAAWAVLTDGRAETISGTATAWRALPAVPPGTAALAPSPGGGFDALAVSGSKLTVWRLDQGASAWARTQAITVPIQYGSS